MLVNILENMVIEGQDSLTGHTLLDYYGFTEISGGYYRTVYTHKDFPEAVFKVLWNEHLNGDGAPNDNVRENALYLYTTSNGINLGMPMAGVLCISDKGYAMAQEKITGQVYGMTLDGESAEEWDYDLSKPYSDAIEAQYLELYPNYRLCGDVHCSNIIVRPDGERVIVDYAGSSIMQIA